MVRIKKITIKQQDSTLEFYQIICPACKEEIRAHEKAQCQINYELYHLPVCRKEKEYMEFKEQDIDILLDSERDKQAEKSLK